MHEREYRVEEIEEAPEEERYAPHPGRRTLSGLLQRKASGASARAPEHIPAGGGLSLPDGLRARAERTLGADLGGVRVHLGTDSARAAADLGARAFAVGQDIHFGAGEYAPGSRAGDHLIAHEVAHTVQQSGAPAPGAQSKLEVSSPGDALETEADSAADAILSDRPAQISRGGAPSIARRLQGDSQAAPPPERQGQGQNAPPATNITPAMFVVAGDGPSVQGQVTSALDTGRGSVAVRAPEIRQEVMVALADGVTLGRDADGPVSVDVGPIQTVLSSERIGVYRRNGDPQGEIVAEHRGSSRVTRDSSWHLDDSGHVVSNYPPPWYGDYGGIMDSHPMRNVSWSDAPAIYLPPNLADHNAALTETRGHDRFVTSISAKQGEQLIHLRTYRWEVPWAVRITDAGGGAGRSPSVSEGGPMVMPRSDEIAAQNEHRFVRYTSVDNALLATTAELLRDLAPALSENRAAARVIADALARRNPAFHMSFEVVDTSNSFGADTIELTIRGNRAHTVTVNGNNGDRRPVNWHWNDIFSAGLTSIDAIEFSAHATNTVTTSSPRTRSWPYPFGGPATTSMRPTDDGDGNYRLRDVHYAP